MNGLVWVFSIVLALVFLITGVNKALRYDQARKLFPWVMDVPAGTVKIIGIAEILGALGLILPPATGIYAWLTPVAAVALVVLTLLAAVFHARRHETSELGLNVILALLAAFVAYGRWMFVPPA